MEERQQSIKESVVKTEKSVERIEQLLREMK